MIQKDVDVQLRNLRCQLLLCQAIHTSPENEVAALVRRKVVMLMGGVVRVI